MSHGRLPIEFDLRSPDSALVASYVEFMEELRANGDSIWERNLPQAGESAAAFADRMARAERDPEPGLVPESTYWAAAGGEVLGRISLRHRLSEGLREFGGHIGYEVRPSARRRGIGDRMLRRLLRMPKAREIGRLLLTCSPANAASIRIIEKNGGVLERTAYVESWKRETNYYWIEIPSDEPGEAGAS